MSDDINIEGRKFILDILKHITTLDTASILILATFIEKLFSGEPRWPTLIPISLCGFTLSIAGSVTAMLCMMVLYGHDIVDDNREDMRAFTVGLSTACTFISFGGFLLGIGSFALFSVKNFYS